MVIQKAADVDTNCKQRDLDRGSPLLKLVLWWIPVAIMIIGTGTFNGRQLLPHALLVIATLWFGTACYINGRRCGRVHCKIDGIMMPLLALLGLLDLLHVISFNWNVYAGAFWGILALSYVPEFLGLVYLATNTGQSSRQNKAEDIYQCPECGLHYRDGTTAKKCEAWCNRHKSCNLEIARLSIERQENTLFDKNNSSNTHKQRDLLHTWSALWLWVLPIILANIANNLYIHHVISFTAQGIAQSAFWLWIGLACLANAFRCGRVHCKIDGTLLPLWSIVGLLNLLGVISLGWSFYSNVGTAIVILSFVAEWLDNTIRHKGSSATVC